MNKRRSSHNELIEKSIELYSKSIETASKDKGKLAIINYVLYKIIDDKIKDKVKNITKTIDINTIEFSLLDYLFGEANIDEFKAKSNEISPSILQEIYENLYHYDVDEDYGLVYTSKIVSDKMALDLILNYFEENSTIKKELLKQFIIEAKLENDVKEHINEKKEMILDIVKNVKCLDMCCGCGALGIALIKLTIKILDKLNKLIKIENLDDYKVNFICNNLYGVDTDEIAIYIYRLRLALIILNINENCDIVSFNNMLVKDALKENKESDCKYDIIIGNPPFISYKSWFNKKYSYLKEYYENGMNFYQYFYCIAIDRLKPKGVMTFVTSNEFLTFDYAKKLRKKLQYQTVIKEIYTYKEYGVFPNEKVSAVINTLSKINNTIVMPDLGNISLDEINKKELLFHNELFKGEKSQIRFYGNNSVTNQILQKIRKYPKIKSDIDVTYGLETGNKFNNTIIHVIDEVRVIKKNNLENNYIKKLGLGREVKKYQVLNEEKSIIYITEKNFTNDIKNIISYIDKKLSVDNNNKYYLKKPKKKAIKFFEASQKIIVRKNGTSFNFGLDDQKKYWKSDVIMILPKEKVNIYFLLGVLNSRIISLFLKNTAYKRKDAFIINKEHILDIPMPKVEDKSINLIQEKVKKIFRKEDIEKNEIELQELIYKIYDLNYEEIEFINKNY